MMQYDDGVWGRVERKKIPEERVVKWFSIENKLIQLNKMISAGCFDLKTSSKVQNDAVLWV